jgi:hypothetical protein
LERNLYVSGLLLHLPLLFVNGSTTLVGSLSSCTVPNVVRCGVCDSTSLKRCCEQTLEEADQRRESVQPESAMKMLQSTGVSALFLKKKRPENSENQQEISAAHRREQLLLIKITSKEKLSPQDVVERSGADHVH